jgi:hypothetical protein
MHPKHPLVIWAVSGDRILFADFEGNTFFEQRLDATESKKGEFKRFLICIKTDSLL